MAHDYFITLIANIVEEKRPKNFPKQIQATIEVSIETAQELMQATNFFASQILRTGGMIVSNPALKNQIVAGTTPETINFDKNIFVPIHMIAYIESATTVKVKQDTGGAQEESVVKLQ